MKVMPMPVPHPIYESDESEYPDRLKVIFRNGKVRTYRLEVEQPKPNLISGTELTELFMKNTYGYQGKHIKK